MNDKQERVESAQQAEPCTNSDSWNCKYCRKTKSCKAIDDPRNYGGAVRPQPADPVAWVRFCSDGLYEGPLMNSDRRMDKVRRASGVARDCKGGQRRRPRDRDLLGADMKPTNAMIGAAHDVTMKEAGIILSHDLIAKIYEAMSALAEQPEVKPNRTVTYVCSADPAALAARHQEPTT